MCLVSFQKIFDVLTTEANEGALEVIITSLLFIFQELRNNVVIPELKKIILLCIKWFLFLTTTAY